MKRYASHYLFVPDIGFLKQYAVELNEGQVVNFFPLTEEIESVEWMPGVIVLEADILTSGLTPYLLYPFDFTTMQPVAETRRRQLR